MSYFFPAQTNHRRVRSELMRVAMRKLAQGSVTGRRAVEGVTHILKGATYLPTFNDIPLDDAQASGMVTAAQAAHHSGKARGLRKGALWCEALNRAGIPVTLDYYTPGEVQLPDLIDTLVEACTEALTANLTQKDIAKIAKVFGLPIVQTGPEGWTEAHDIAHANSIMANYAAQDAAEAGDMDAAAAYAEQAAKIAQFTMAHAMGNPMEEAIGGQIIDLPMQAAMEGATVAPASHQIEQDAPGLSLEAMIAAAVAKELAKVKVSA